MKISLVEHYFKAINRSSAFKNKIKKVENLEAIRKSIVEDNELKDYEAILLLIYLKNVDKM